MGKLTLDEKVNLIFYNLVPVVGVVFWSWSLFTVLLIYWVETAIMGCINVLKISISNPIYEVEDKESKMELLVLHLIKLFLVPFFCVHFGGFMAGHFVFISSIYGPGKVDLFNGEYEVFFSLFNWELILAVTCIFLGHAYYFVKEFLLNKEYLYSNPSLLMFGPYPRVIVMHLFIIFGSMIHFVFHNLIGSVLLMSTLKLGSDIAMLISRKETLMAKKKTLNVS